MSLHRISAARLFDGTRFHGPAGLEIAEGRVRGLVAPQPGAEAFGDVTLCPGFIDWQVNGGGGVLFNETPTPEGIAAIAAAHARFGTTALLPTLITDREAVTEAAAGALRAAIAAGMPGVVGGHFEGPHLALARKGAHDPALIRPITAPDIARLAAPGLGRVVTTVAPEAAGAGAIAALTAAGVLVSLGHSDCTYADAMAGFAAGARAVTHLFNAMSGPGHREPGLAGAALDHPDVWIGVIADGHHVHPAALRLALAAAGAGRMTLVTDAMPTVGFRGDVFHLNGREVRREAGRLTLPGGVLAGSDLDMAGAVRFAVEVVGVPLAQALRMASTLPARMLGLRDRGHLTPGARADIVALDAGLRVVAVWIGGARVA